MGKIRIQLFERERLEPDSRRAPDPRACGFELLGHERQRFIPGRFLQLSALARAHERFGQPVGTAGKVMAEAPAQWKDETSKPRNSNIVTTGDQVTEIHFSGKMRYVTVGPVESKLN